MASFSITGPIKCKRMTSFSPLSFSAPYDHSCNISIPGKLTRKVHSHANSLSSSLYHSSWHRNLYSEKRGLSLIAFDANNSKSEGEDNQALDAVIKLYSALKSKNTHELSADERLRVTNFFESFQGRTEVLEYFSKLVSIFRNNVQIVVKPIPKDGINVGLHWKFDWNKIHFPLGKGFSLQISHTYQGKAVMRNLEIFMEPLLNLKPLGQKMKVGLSEFMEKIDSFMVSESGNKATRIFYVVLGVLSLVAFLFFMKLAS